MTDPIARDEFGAGEVPRTDLAWNRTGLALAVATMAVLKVVVDVDDYRAPILVFAILLGGAVAWALSFAHGRAVASDTLEGRIHHDQRRLRRVARITLVFAIGALVIALLPQR